MSGGHNGDEFTRNGYLQMLESREWKRPTGDEEYLDAGLFGRISQLNTWLASSLFLSVERLYGRDDDSTTRSIANKSEHVLNWFEKNFGSVIGDGNGTMYAYRINDTQFQIWTTANLLLGMIATRDLFDRMYTRPFFVEHLGEPELTDVEYPKLHVNYAFYIGQTRCVEFGLKTDGVDDLFGVSFRIRNVDGFRNATMIANNHRFIDLSQHVRLNSTARSLEFFNLTIFGNSSNRFFVYF